jgi:hypothetical protein
MIQSNKDICTLESRITSFFNQSSYGLPMNMKLIISSSKKPLLWVQYLKWLETVKCRSPATLLAYIHDFKIFLAWARLHGAKPETTLLALSVSEKACRYTYYL